MRYRIAYCLPGMGEDYRDVEAGDESQAMALLAETLMRQTGVAPLPLGTRWPYSRVIATYEESPIPPELDFYCIGPCA